MTERSGKERRRSPRVRTRIQCEVCIDGTPSPGRVLDVSEGGLSVETEPGVDQGDPVRVVLKPPSVEPFEVSALAWHCRPVRLASGGTSHVLGLMLSSAPEAYREFLPQGSLNDSEAAQEEEAPSAEPASADPGAPVASLESFRIRVGQGARTRTLSLSATNVDEARLLAAENLAGDWDILEVRAR